MQAWFRRFWVRWLLRPANVVFPVAVLVTRFQHPGWIAATAVAHLVFFWAVMNPRCGWLGPVVTRFRTAQKEVWLTIDDGPDGERTLELARELQRRSVRATFFLIGNRVTSQPEAVPALVALGHTVANHTATHPRKTFWCLPASQVREEMAGGAAALPTAPGAKLRWFRSPVGHKPLNLHDALEGMEVRLIAWTVGGRDGWKPDASHLVRRLLARAHPGAIIMLHERRAYSVPTILAVVDAFLAHGYRFTIPADDMLEG